MSQFCSFKTRSWIDGAESDLYGNMLELLLDLLWSKMLSAPSNEWDIINAQFFSPVFAHVAPSGRMRLAAVICNWKGLYKQCAFLACSYVAEHRSQNQIHTFSRASQSGQSPILKINHHYNFTRGNISGKSRRERALEGIDPLLLALQLAILPLRRLVLPWWFSAAASAGRPRRPRRRADGSSSKVGLLCVLPRLCSLWYPLVASPIPDISVLNCLWEW